MPFYGCPFFSSSNKVNRINSNRKKAEEVEPIYEEPAIPKMCKIAISNKEPEEVELILNAIIEIDYQCRIDLLALNNCNLRKIPDELASFKRLKWLDLSDNCLSSLPEQVFKECVELREINFDNNQFKDIPDLLKHLPQLKSFSLTDNLLKEKVLYFGSTPGRFKRSEAFDLKSNSKKVKLEWIKMESSIAIKNSSAFLERLNQHTVSLTTTTSASEKQYELTATTRAILADECKSTQLFEKALSVSNY